MGLFDIAKDIASLPLDMAQDTISLGGVIDNDGDSHTVDRLKTIMNGHSGKTMISSDDLRKIKRQLILNKVLEKNRAKKKLAESIEAKNIKIDLKLLSEYDKLDNFEAIREYLNSDGRRFYWDNEYFYHFRFKDRFFGLGFQSTRFLIVEYYTNRFRREKGETQIINFKDL